MLCVFFKANGTGSDDSQLPYRQQVIRALVQRYIESARREFEETKRKGDCDTHLSGYNTQTISLVTCCILSSISLVFIYYYYY